MSIIGRIALVVLTIALPACSDLYFGDKPGREFPKETGPLTVRARKGCVRGCEAIIGMMLGVMPQLGERFWSQPAYPDAS